MMVFAIVTNFIMAFWHFSVTIILLVNKRNRKGLMGFTIISAVLFVVCMVVAFGLLVKHCSI